MTIAVYWDVQHQTKQNKHMNYSMFHYSAVLTDSTQESESSISSGKCLFSDLIDIHIEDKLRNARIGDID